MRKGRRQNVSDFFEGDSDSGAKETIRAVMRNKKLPYKLFEGD